MNCTPYPVSKEDYILVEIMHNNNFIVSSREYGGEKWRDGNVVRVSFTVREAGAYKISVLAQGKPIRGSPFTKTFLPGAVNIFRELKGLNGKKPWVIPDLMPNSPGGGGGGDSNIKKVGCLSSRLGV